MKKVLLMAAVAVSMLSSCGSSSIKDVKSLNTLQDSVSYAYGAYIGSSLKNMFGDDNSDMSIETLAAGIKAAMDGNAILEQESINATLQNYFTVVKPERDKSKDSLFLAGVLKDNKKAKKTESGLIYEIIDEGDVSNKPTMADTVMSLYTGTFANGEVFDSTKDRNDEPAPLVLGALIQGFNEGIQMIGNGGKIKLWVPANIAYGDKLMIFEVEIKDIKKPAVK